MGYFAGSLAAYLGLVLLLSQIAVDSGGASVDLAMQETVDLHAVGTIAETTLPEQLAEIGEGGTEDVASASMHLDPGAAGTPESNQTGRLEMKNNGTPPLPGVNYILAADDIYISPSRSFQPTPHARHRLSVRALRHRGHHRRRSAERLVHIATNPAARPTNNPGAARPERS